MAGEGDDNDAADKEDVLHAVGLPRKVFEVEFEGEHGEFADHKDVGDEGDGNEAVWEDGAFYNGEYFFGGIEGTAVGSEGDTYPNEGVGGYR